MFSQSCNTRGGGKFVIILLLFSLLLPPFAMGADSVQPWGTLKGIYSQGSVEVRDVARIDAVFENTRATSTSATFVGEARLDGKLVKSLRSNELRVYPREEINLTCYFVPQEAGTYEISGYVVYSKISTDVKESLLRVLPRTDQGPDKEVVQLGAGVATIIIVMLCVVVLYVVKKKDSSGEEDGMYSLAAQFLKRALTRRGWIIGPLVVAGVSVDKKHEARPKHGFSRPSIGSFINYIYKKRIR